MWCINISLSTLLTMLFLCYYAGDIIGFAIVLWLEACRQADERHAEDMMADGWSLDLKAEPYRSPRNCMGCRKRVGQECHALSLRFLETAERGMITGWPTFIGDGAWCGAYEPDHCRECGGLKIIYELDYCFNETGWKKWCEDCHGTGRITHDES